MCKLFGLQWQGAFFKDVSGKYRVRFPGNNTWPVRVPLRTSRINRSSLMARKPVRKQKKNAKKEKYIPLFSRQNKDYIFLQKD
ncbi:hypothetical protein MTR_7g068300 [Medicago truncatula]|uniref:Uncharacterized protein n=1 Tax=Medicago truncatula TaxID=3880 RepID=G7KS92_MEDTR|nr:hypothetical protein MTR_7g068300 [Medicago truncatula]